MPILRRSTCLGILLLVCCALYSQIPVEPRARLQASIEREPESWYEGLSGAMRGTEASYESHRSLGKRDPAVVVRTNDVGKSIEWQTQQIDKQPKGDVYRFLWTCGFGSNQGNEPFVLLVNGEKRFAFTTSNDSEWTVAGRGGGFLTFTLMGRSQYGASLGYMCLEAPVAWCTVGKPLVLQIVPASSTVDIWYRLYAYTNSLSHFMMLERKTIYASWRCPNFGDAMLAIVTQGKNAGKVVTVSTPGGSLGSCSLLSQGTIARSELTIPRDQQRLLSPPILVRIGAGVADTVESPDFEERRIKAFMEEEIRFEKYLFTPGPFPTASWKNTALVRNLIGTADLQAVFFNNSFEKVEVAALPGRYGAMITSRTSDGFIVRRFVTLYCVPLPYESWIRFLVPDATDQSVNAPPNPWNGFQRTEINRFLSGKEAIKVIHDPESAVFFAGLSDMVQGDGVNDSPRIRDRQWWIDLKQKLGGNSQVVNPLRPLVTSAQDVGTLLRESEPSKSGYRSEDLEQIRNICASWTKETGVPNATLIACNGEIFFYEAFGKDANGTPIQKSTPMWMASITKLLTGTLMMQFVDQGLVDLDAPVAKYLNELPQNGPPVLTVRDLFTHTNGFGWHGEWASDWNMTLENYLAQCLSVCHVRERHQYNRMGYAVAGKIMERLAGRSVPTLFRDFLLLPLGMSKTFVDNTYGSCQATAYDIALVGQMLLNRGRAGAIRFFSEKAFDQMLPQPIMGPKGRLAPDWGIGTSWLGGSGFSGKTFGHEAASGALLRIDPESKIVLVSARNRIGENYSAYESFKTRLLSAAATAVRNRRIAR